MPVESDADRAAFLDPADFGQTAAYTPAGGAPVSIDGIFDNGHFRIDGVAEVPITSARPTFICRAADLPAGAAQGDEITVDAVDYVVRELQPDGTGMTVIELEKA